VGGEKSVKAIVAELTLKGFETNLLQNNVAVGIGKDFFPYAIAALQFSVDKFIAWNASLERFVLKGAMTFFLGEEIVAAGHDESQVASTRLIYSGKVNFI
jgi:hypothetical protein